MAMLAAAVALAVMRSTSGWGALLLAAFCLAPLLAPLPGIMRGHRRTYAWATLCVTPYLVYGVTESVSNPRVRGLAAVVLLASFALFLALVAHLRLTRPAAASDQRD